MPEKPMTLAELLKSIQPEGANPLAPAGELGGTPVPEAGGFKQSLKQILAAGATGDPEAAPAAAPQGSASGLQALLGGTIPPPSGVGGPNSAFGTAGPYNGDSISPADLSNLQNQSALGQKAQAAQGGGMPVVGAPTFGSAGGMGAGAPPPAMVAKQDQQAAAPAMNADGQPFIGQSDSAPAGADNAALLSYLASQNRSLNPTTGREGSGGPVDPAEAIAKQALALRDKTFASRVGGFGNEQAAADASGIANLFLSEKGSAGKEAHQLALGNLDNQGRLAVAQEASRATQLTHLDSLEAHTRDQVDKGLMTKQDGQRMIDSYNARRANLTLGGSSPTGSGSPAGGGAPPPSTVLSPSLADNFMGAKRVLGKVDPATGRYTPNEALSGAEVTQLVDGLDPAKVPELASAILSGSLGDPTKITHAVFNSLGQNHFTAQGAPTTDDNGGFASSQELKYGDQPLLTFGVGKTGAIGTVAASAASKLAGTAFDQMTLPNGKVIPFDRSPIHGISPGAQNFGVNQGEKQQAASRVPTLAQLAKLLSETKPPTGRGR